MIKDKNCFVLPPSDNPLIEAMVAMGTIAKEFGIEASIDASTIKRVQEAAYETKGNVDVPVILSGATKSLQFVLHISDEGVAIEVFPCAEKTSTEPLNERVIRIGEPFPAIYPKGWSGLIPTLDVTGFRLYVLAPRITPREVEAFNGQATFIAIHEKAMLYLGICCGEDVLAADSSYTIYRDSPEAQAAILPQVTDLPECKSIALLCVLIDSATGMVRGMRFCVPPGFTRRWIAAIQEQRTTPYDDQAGSAWAGRLLSQYPTTRRLTEHPNAAVAVMGVVQKQDPQLPSVSISTLTNLPLSGSTPRERR